MVQRSADRGAEQVNGKRGGKAVHGVFHYLRQRPHTENLETNRNKARDRHSRHRPTVGSRSFALSLGGLAGQEPRDHPHENIDRAECNRSCAQAHCGHQPPGRANDPRDGAERIGRI